jgi:GNAT superfamily N-acetyltransferase
VPDDLVLRLAGHSDAELVGEASSFFHRIDQRIEAGELFVLERDGEPAGFGIREMSRLVPGRASIGMFTRKAQRQRGVGSALVALLIQRCMEEDIEPVSGCWYYNHRSRHALERAGRVLNIAGGPAVCRSSRVPIGRIHDDMAFLL